MEGDVVIYRGGHHRVVCRDGRHYQQYEDGRENLILGTGGACATWSGGCLAEQTRSLMTERTISKMA